MNKPRAMLIDLDDTIIDDGSGVEACWRLVCADAADRVASLDADDLFHEILRTRHWYWSDPERHRIGRADLRAASVSIVRWSLCRLGFDLPDLAHDLGLLYRTKRGEGTELIPGAVEALLRFRSYGIGLALITNGSAAGQRAKIDRFDLGRHFDHIFIEGEIGFGKPEREVYLMAMAALGGTRRHVVCGRQSGLGSRGVPEAGHLQCVDRPDRRGLASRFRCNSRSYRDLNRRAWILSVSSTPMGIDGSG